MDKKFKFKNIFTEINLFKFFFVLFVFTLISFSSIEIYNKVKSQSIYQDYIIYQDTSGKGYINYAVCNTDNGDCLAFNNLNKEKKYEEN